MTLKYKNGDTVRISYAWYQKNKDNIAPEISHYLGQDLTIEEINEEEGFYYLYEDIEGFKWTEEMFEEINSEFKIGQIVYLSSQTSPTKITYIKEIDGDNILLDNGLSIKAKSIDDIINLGLLIIKFK